MHLCIFKPGQDYFARKSWLQGEEYTTEWIRHFSNGKSNFTRRGFAIRRRFTPILMWNCEMMSVPAKYMISSLVAGCGEARGGDTGCNAP